MRECQSEDCIGGGYESFFRLHDPEAQVNVYECTNCGKEFQVPC